MLQTHVLIRGTVIPAPLDRKFGPGPGERAQGGRNGGIDLAAEVVERAIHADHRCGRSNRGYRSGGCRCWYPATNSAIAGVGVVKGVTASKEAIATGTISRVVDFRVVDLVFGRGCDLRGGLLVDRLVYFGSDGKEMQDEVLVVTYRYGMRGCFSDRRG